MVRQVVGRIGVGIVAFHAALVGLAHVAGHTLPYGGEIAFVSHREGQRDIFLMDVTRNQFYNLTRNAEAEYAPEWSPDGSRLVFAQAQTPDGNADIYVMDANGRNIQRLTTRREHEAIPTWSPDGAQIAYISYDNGDAYDPHLYMMGMARGSRLRPDDLGLIDSILTFDWSPDGRQIAYVPNRVNSADCPGICLTNTQGNDRQVLWLDDGGAKFDLDWSPDGRWLLFMTEFGGDYSSAISDIERVELETGKRQRLTGGNAYNGYARWTPDGEQIVFTSWRDGNAELYIMDADGDNERRLTFHPAHDVTPVWRP